jgi:hypothetical protein
VFLHAEAALSSKKMEPFDAPVVTRGEFVLVIGQSTNKGTFASADTPEIASVFGEITNQADVGSRREAVKATAARLGLSPKAVYEALERAKHEPEG